MSQSDNADEEYEDREDVYGERERMLVPVQGRSITRPDFNVQQAPLARLEMTPDQVAIIQAPIDPAEIEFRWMDKNMTQALAYAPQAAARMRLSKAFPGRWCIVEHSIRNDGDTIVYHGSLYIDGFYIASAYGEQDYIEGNENMSRATALAGAKSSCIKRCCNDLGMFLELYDKKFTGPHEARWIEANRMYCPKIIDGKPCGKAMRRSATEWYCWYKTGGCGHKFPIDDDSPVVPHAVTPVAAPATPVAVKAPPAPLPPAETPKKLTPGDRSRAAKAEHEKQDRETEVKATIKKEIDETLSDPCFKDVDRIAANKALPKFEATGIEAMTKFLANLKKALDERNCNHLLPF